MLALSQTESMSADQLKGMSGWMFHVMLAYTGVQHYVDITRSVLDGQMQRNGRAWAVLSSGSL